MIWVDRVAKKIAEQKNKKQWVDDMKTPSGRIHVGSLRGVIVHDLVYKVLKENKLDVHYSYVFNDMDPMDGLPTYLDQKIYSQYMGKPLYKIPSPVPGFESYAQYFAQEFIEVFNSINCHPETIWSSKLYQSGKMNEVIKITLDNAQKIREIYKKIAKADRSPYWFPFNPICKKCGNIGTTNTYKWDGENVYYRCEKNIVTWAQGCGYEGKVSPYDGRGKLPWKVDWAAHWKVIGITIESSGKDHMSSGGSYDLASAFCREIFDIEPPDSLGGYEWFTIGGRKMSSSKGVGSSAKEVAKILPPDVFRFMLVRTPITTHLDFNPDENTLFNLFDDYDRCLSAYFDKLEYKIPKGKPGEVISDFARIMELSQVKPLPKKILYYDRIRTIVNLLKNNRQSLVGFFENLKKSQITKEEKEILEERTIYAKKLLGRREKPTEFKLNNIQKDFLKELALGLKTLNNPDREQIQKVIFETLKKGDYKPKEVFQGFYRILTGQNFGPKATDLVLQIGIENTIQKINCFLTAAFN